MKKALSIIFSAIIILLVNASIAYACTPCPPEAVLNFDQTVQEADLIIIGQKTKDGPRTAPKDQQGGPDWIKVRVYETIKGEVNSPEIKVDSYQGMCGYGIVVDDKQYVMMLKKINGEYGAVANGCSEKTYLIVDGQAVQFQGQNISLDEFVQKLGEGAKRQKISEAQATKNPWVMVSGILLITVGLFGLSIIIVLVILFTKLAKK